jgi:hypothetical protein
MQIKKVEIMNGNHESIQISEQINPDQIRIMVADSHGWGTIVLSRLELEELVTAFDQFRNQEVRS